MVCTAIGLSVPSPPGSRQAMCSRLDQTPGCPFRFQKQPYGTLLPWRHWQPGLLSAGIKIAGGWGSVQDLLRRWRTGDNQKRLLEYTTVIRRVWHWPLIRLGWYQQRAEGFVSSRAHERPSLSCWAWGETGAETEGGAGGGGSLRDHMTQKKWKVTMNRSGTTRNTCNTTQRDENWLNEMHDNCKETKQALQSKVTTKRWKMSTNSRTMTK